MSLSQLNVRSLMSDRTTDITSSDRHQVGPWLRRKSGISAGKASNLSAVAWITCGDEE
jgi:hypothetical protein